MKNPRRAYKKRLTIKEVQTLGYIPKDCLAPKEKSGRSEGIAYMKSLGWLVIPIHCDEMLKGFPDTTCYHRVHGHKLVEWKSMRVNHVLEPSQVERFWELEKHGGGIWVLRNAAEYCKLFAPPNWREYMAIMRV